ncbi:MAG: SDR family NAD(P)-dependent oxidoreductase [Pseudomonadales bacterium]|nr:SDR family NAD(P)-dependent oxidoreductase [Pseudomonadales bacterium]MBO6703451.1 SDR family NAD(P)-dependent oxidoreductase [Pseudomonadales bacterium]MBO7004557.1 SDR family NAD(P)-dependent oxidoreductase [Pseudomonadales bacterium]
MPVRFDHKVVLVTGASRGLGKAFAHCLAEAGAMVALNSTSEDDRGATQSVADAGGEALHFTGRVEDSEDLVNRVVERCGRLDAVVHNAGFIQDKTLKKMSNEQWDAVVDVHLKTSFKLSRAAWPHFENQGGGRIVLLSSSAGMYGNFGQANYASAKMGMYGLAQSIALEGAKFNITCNCVSPFGATEMNSANFPEALKTAIKTEYVAPLVAYLAHEDCKESGSMFEASAGSFKKVRWERSVGLNIDPRKEAVTLDAVAENWYKITDFSESEHPANMGEALQGMYGRTLGA